MHRTRTPEQRARRLLDDGTDMLLATADVSGTPWVSPVFYVPDDGYDLYWTSDRDARHSRNIRDRSNVAIVVYETEQGADAVYISAQARELNDAGEVGNGIEIMTRKPQPDRWVIQGLSDVTGQGPWRIYRAAVQTIDVRSETEKDGKPVATRQAADFRGG
jgi:nitroimidazol reductase NimA-like FMN-containing flavoprotein (pyridoxamine 5'-phosphate oxidase superfamily)